MGLHRSDLARPHPAPRRGCCACVPAGAARRPSPASRRTAGGRPARFGRGCGQPEDTFARFGYPPSQGPHASRGGLVHARRGGAVAPGGADAFAPGRVLVGFEAGAGEQGRRVGRGRGRRAGRGRERPDPGGRAGPGRPTCARPPGGWPTGQGWRTPSRTGSAGSTPATRTSAGTSSPGPAPTWSRPTTAGPGARGAPWPWSTPGWRPGWPTWPGGSARAGAASSSPTPPGSAASRRWPRPPAPTGPRWPA